jgi:chromosome partitioning protein
MPRDGFLAPVIALASTKGGVGKTTLAFCLATEIARRPAPTGVPPAVACIDADPNRTLAEALRLAGMAAIRCAEADGESLLAELRRAQREAHIVLIDLEGSANQAMLYACGKANLVLIPAQPSRFDVLEAVKTAGVVRQAADLVGRDIPHLVVLSRTPVLRQRVAEHSRRQFEKAGLAVARTELMQRTAFQQMTFTGRPPYAQDPRGNAALNVEALTDEVLAVLAPAAAVAA